MHLLDFLEFISKRSDIIHYFQVTGHHTNWLNKGRNIQSVNILN